MRWQQKEEKQKRAEELGYTTIEGAFIGLYEELQSTSKVAKKMGITTNATKYVLRKHGITLRGRGGDNSGQAPSKRQKEVFQSMVPGKWYTARQIPEYVPKQTSAILWHLWKKGKVERKVYKKITVPRYMYIRR